jgi:short-subunit dehydrogenase
MASKPIVLLPGANVLITGAGSGIGRATALAFAQRRSHVIVVDVQQAAAEKVASECEERGATAEALVCDVTDYDAVLALAADVNARVGPPDVLVNNAGVGLTGRFLDTTIDDWNWIRAVNIDGVMHFCHAFGPALVERGRGHVVNVSSGLAYTPHCTETAYVATKAAVLGFSLSLRADWSEVGVGVSAVCPGIINTPIAQSTRYRGARGDDATKAKTQKTFARGHAPKRVARGVVRAVEHNRAVVPVGFEAHAGWWFHRLAPTAVQQRLARSQRL